MKIVAIPNYEPCNTPDEFFNPITITLGELYEGGFIDFSDPSWKWDSYDQEQFERMNSKIMNRFYYREIGVIPPGRWKLEFLRIINETMPKLKPLYKYIADDGNILSNSDTFGKNRTIYSEFPQTMLGDNQDYASTGEDNEFETIVQGDFLAKAEAIATRYNDVDVILLDRLETCFSSLISLNMNGF